MTRERADFQNADSSPWAAYDPPRAWWNTRHRARFFYKLYTDRASEAACGYLDAKRQHKGPIYVATRMGQSCNWTPYYTEYLPRLHFSIRAIEVYLFCITLSNLDI